MVADMSVLGGTEQVVKTRGAEASNHADGGAQQEQGTEVDESPSKLG